MTRLFWQPRQARKVRGELRKTIKRTAAWLLALGTLAAGAGGQAPAPPPATPLTIPSPPAPTPPARFVPRVATHLETENGKTFSVLTINELEAATIRTVAGGFTPQQRAQVATNRLVILLQNDLAPSEIVAKPATKPLWNVEARGGTLMLATPGEADAHGHMSPEELARHWVKALRQLISQPPLTLTPAGLIVPLGETRTVRVGGAALAADVQVGSNNDGVSAAAFDPRTRLLTIQGRAPGRSEIVIEWVPSKGAVAMTLPVSVMQYAGQITPSVTMQVTGNPVAPADLVTQAAFAGVTRAIGLEDGAQVALSSPPRFTSPLAAGAQTSALFPLRLSGPNLLPVTADADVHVINIPVTPHPPTSLLYSNNPEQIKHGQPLFSGSLPAGGTTRLDYHHQNISGGLLVFHVDLRNDSDSPASVQVIAGLSLPGTDTVQVGRRAGAAFLRNLNGNFGLVFPVPPHTSVPLITQRFAPGLTVSGLMQLQSLSGGAVTITVSAGADTDTLTAPLGRLFLAGTGGSALAAPSAGTRLGAGTPSPYIFPRPQITLAGRYIVDKGWTFISLGDKEALRNVSGKLRLYGNYGADYDVTLTLTNPTPDTRQVGIYFAPGAGLAAGVFQVDNGPILEYDPFEPPDERQLELVTLAPGETRVTHLHTIPLNGSSYPASLVARALDKRPAPPTPAPVTIPAPTPAAAVSTLPAGKASR